MQFCRLYTERILTNDPSTLIIKHYNEGYSLKPGPYRWRGAIL